MTLPLDSPPSSLCILRLSAVGDISHTLPIVRTVQHFWPQTALSWIIGKSELQLVHDIPDIEFIPFDKKAGWRGYTQIRRQLSGRHFDVLLHMQMSLRASLLSTFVKSPIKLGFDRTRAKDLQWLFSNHKIAYHPRQHVIDSFFGFTEALGIREHRYEWDLPVPDLADSPVLNECISSHRYVVISPCSSMAYRNWTAKGYAGVADYIQQHSDLKVVLCGGPSAIEADYATAIKQACHEPVIDLIGKTSLKELLAVLKAAELVIAPDAGPAHLANAVATPVIGLYATTNPDRARPYNYPDLVVNKYTQAIQDKFHKQVDEVEWGTRVRDPGTMERISTDDVIAMFRRWLNELTDAG